jgi:hypothetical protein
MSMTSKTIYFVSRQLKKLKSDGLVPYSECPSFRIDLSKLDSDDPGADKWKFVEKAPKDWPE